MIRQRGVDEQLDPAVRPHWNCAGGTIHELVTQKRDAVERDVQDRALSPRLKPCMPTPPLVLQSTNRVGHHVDDVQRVSRAPELVVTEPDALEAAVDDALEARDGYIGINAQKMHVPFNPHYQLNHAIVML
jgi:hypothetical protein